ncbi:MAG: hypothetical protein ACRDOO_29570 [Actinomadura sp.]
MSREVSTTVDATSLSLGPVVDAVCSEIHAGWACGETFSTLRLSPALYDLIATSKAREIQRGNPVMLLSLDVIADDTIPDTRATLD